MNNYSFIIIILLKRNGFLRIISINQDNFINEDNPECIMNIISFTVSSFTAFWESPIKDALVNLPKHKHKYTPHRHILSLPSVVKGSWDW